MFQQITPQIDIIEPGTSFAGYEMAQTWADLQLYEKVLNDRPDLKCIIELGTGQGGLSLFFDSQARARGLEFHNFDYLAAEKPVPKWQQIDVLADSITVREFFTHPMLLLCDNGNKPLEVKIYAPLLQVGDLLAVHDWNVEIFASDIPGALYPVYDHWSHSLTRIFEVGA